MPHYVSLMRWTSKGVAGLPAWRERVEEGERIVEEAGGKLVGVYVTLGRYDVVEIFEAPDDDTAAEILMKLQRHGAEHTETLRAFTRDEAEAIVKRLSGAAAFGDRLEALADLVRALAEVVEPRQRRERLEPEDALEQRRRAVANRAADALLAPGLGDQAALDEARRRPSRPRRRGCARSPAG